MSIERVDHPEEEPRLRAVPEPRGRDRFPDEFRIQKQAWSDGCRCLWMDDKRLRYVEDCPLHSSEP